MYFYIDEHVIPMIFCTYRQSTCLCYRNEAAWPLVACSTSDKKNLKKKNQRQITLMK